MPTKCMKTPAKNIKYKVSARHRYTKNAMAAKRKTVRFRTAWGEAGRRKDIACTFDDNVCLQRLQNNEYADEMPDSCPTCGMANSLRGPQTRSGKHPSMLYYKCQLYGGCSAWHNVMKFSRFRDTKLSAGQVHSIVRGWTDLGKYPPASVDDLASDAGAGRHQTDSIVRLMRKAVAVRAAKESQRGSISGDVEMDETGIRVTHISATNRKYSQEIARLKEKAKRQGKRPKYFLLYVRLIGLRARNGNRVFVKFLPEKLVMPGAKPPPLSITELANCGLLKRCQKKKTVVFTDGAKAYHSYITQQMRGDLISRQVSHKRLQFTKKVRTPKGHSKIAGTQSIDATWATLKKNIPNSVHSKSDHAVNPMLREYVMAWAWRHNHREEDGFASVGKMLNE
jgi:hypothetical protein